jgi:T5SS/PEP-CTERM-associated repeat protein
VNVTADQTANVRFAPLTGGEATVNVLGQGSVFSATGSTSGYGGSVGVGQAGSADVTVSDGGKFETLYMTAGGDSVPENASPENYNIGGTGNFDVDGSGSELLMQGSGTAGYGSFLNIGRRGTGSLDVTNGGSVSISSEQGTFPGFVVGRSADGDGSAVVDGPNSDITVSGDQGTAGDGGYAGYIGIGKEGGTGTLTVRNGGSVMNDSAGLTQVGGSFPSAASDQTDGSITVTGSGSSFDAGDQLIIGGGFDFGSGQPIFDQPGTGSVTVENGATLTAGDGEGDGETDIFVGNNGSLQVASGASLTGDVQTDAGGVFAMGASPGLAMVQGNADIGGATTFELDGTGDGDFDRLEAGGAVTLGGDVTVDVGRGFTPEAGDSFPIVEADGGASLASDLAVSTSGLPDDLAIDLTANGGSIVATVMDSGSDPDALA